MLTLGSAALTALYLQDTTVLRHSIFHMIKVDLVSFSLSLPIISAACPDEMFILQSLGFIRQLFTWKCCQNSVIFSYIILVSICKFQVLIQMKAGVSHALMKLGWGIMDTKEMQLYLRSNYSKDPPFSSSSLCSTLLFRN